MKRKRRISGEKRGATRISAVYESFFLPLALSLSLSARLVFFNRIANNKDFVGLIRDNERQHFISIHFIFGSSQKDIRSEHSLALGKRRAVE